MHLDAVWLHHEDTGVTGVLREGTDEARMVLDLCPLGEGRATCLAITSSSTCTIATQGKIP